MAPRRDITDEPELADFDFSRVLNAIADPIRLAIVVQLAEGSTELRCGSFDLPVHPSTATHHFTALRQAGVIHQYYSGTARMNVLRRDDLEEAFPGFLESVVRAASKAPAG
ncbi:helix-turn-helix transcriptional regulator [Arthrobacter sp. Sa2BUA2]|uniref:Helix-turn-helix transcriptional regulator n=1 Tax=Arthrobacter pullicola TaxID=2762224 RepID=A0ABR8YLW7_9MICC|nr:ArsR family transcriptional regulator [Arthrobacter pullicola]MBD8044904.1 helix-turn-helix transcriptional regulator [Arthrobacter pullicola]